MSVNDASRIIIDDSRVTLQSVASLTDNSKDVIYNCSMFIVQVSGDRFIACRHNFTSAKESVRQTFFRLNACRTDGF